MTMPDRVRIPEHVMRREVGDESVMLDLEKGTYFGLDPVGTRVWQMLAEGKAPAEIPGALAEEFDAPRERIEEDVIRLLGELLAQGLLIRD
jgi:hypothetical protein